MNKMSNKILLKCFVHSSPMAAYKMFWNVVRGFHSAVLCTVAVRSNNLTCVAALPMCLTIFLAVYSLLVEFCL